MIMEPKRHAFFQDCALAASKTMHFGVLCKITALKGAFGGARSWCEIAQYNGVKNGHLIPPGFYGTLARYGIPKTSLYQLEPPICFRLQVPSAPVIMWLAPMVHSQNLKMCPLAQKIWQFLLWTAVTFIISLKEASKVWKPKVYFCGMLFVFQC